MTAKFIGAEVFSNGYCLGRFFHLNYKSYLDFFNSSFSRNRTRTIDNSEFFPLSSEDNLFILKRNGHFRYYSKDILDIMSTVNSEATKLQINSKHLLLHCCTKDVCECSIGNMKESSVIPFGPLVTWELMTFCGYPYGLSLRMVV